jgi:hypothetical protein
VTANVFATPPLKKDREDDGLWISYFCAGNSFIRSEKVDVLEREEALALGALASRQPDFLPEQFMGLAGMDVENLRFPPSKATQFL